MRKEMLINVREPEECRIAIVENGVLEELYVERASQENYVGNIYKGKIVNLEPSIQAAFVDFGVGRNGFLHISDVEPQYFRQGGYDPNVPLEDERDSRRRAPHHARSKKRDDRPPRRQPELEQEAEFEEVTSEIAEPIDEIDSVMDSATDSSTESGVDNRFDAGDSRGDELADDLGDDSAGEREPVRETAGHSESSYEAAEGEQAAEDENFGEKSFEFAEAADDDESGEEEAPREESRHRHPRHQDRHRNHNDDDSGDSDEDDDVPDEDSRPRRKIQRFGARPRVKPPIQEIFRRGDEILVQVIKEGIGNKGPTLSTYISIPGRYLVLMPPLGRVGVSRKIEDDAARRRLRDFLVELKPPKGLGFIVRTAGVERTKKELSRDMAYLVRLWKVIVRRLKKKVGPGDIYEESDMMIRTIRDIFTADVDAIYIDEKEAYERAKEFLQLVMPRYSDRLHLYEGKEPLFYKHNLEQEIANISKRTVPLKSGGSIVIDSTEALVAIDVNSGNFRTNGSAEDSAFEMNMQAAREIGRQLRLRDLGGVIVNDFIDMRKEKHRRGVERALRDAVRRDRARTKILRTSPFGLIEMTRQRIRPSLKRSIFKDCPCCEGRAVVKSPESMAIDVIRSLRMAVNQPSVNRVVVRVHEEVAAFLNNNKRRELARIEEEANVTVQILGSGGYYPEHLEIDCRDSQGREVKLTVRLT